MGHQTKVSERNGSSQTAPRAFARDVGGFAYDVLTLAELQVQLFASDMRECGQRVFVPGLVLLCGAALGWACFPVALAALALLIIQVFETSYATGFLLATTVGAISSVLLCISGWFLVREPLALLQRSQEELVRNLRWIKKVLERNRTTRSNSTDNSWRTVR
jgi:uncharacterized membrane protein YqjE